MTAVRATFDAVALHAAMDRQRLGRTPESFLTPPAVETAAMRLPAVGTAKRLRWNLAALYDAVNAQRQDRQLTWVELARELRCTQSQLTGIKTAKFAIGMTLAMKIVVWLDQPAARFVCAASW